MLVRSPARLRRDTVLKKVLDPRRLPTPPAVALQVVSAAARPDCTPREIVALLAQDPALCAKLLKAVNSCMYGLTRPVASLERAVAVLGLGPLRSLALGLSLPAVQAGPADLDTRNHQITSVAGAIIARDLSARTPRTAPDDDLVAGLLRDVGAVLLRQAYPDAWRDMTERWGDRLLAQACEAEEETFGVSHAEVSAEMLGVWHLPAEIVEPIRHHHSPERLAGAGEGLARRAELLYFAGLLAGLDTVVRHPRVLEYVFDVARTRYGLPKPELIRFMRGVVPKVTAFGELLNRDVRDCPDFADALSAGGQELVNLAIETSRPRVSGNTPVPAFRPLPPAAETFALSIRPADDAPDIDPAATCGPELPEFRHQFLETFPVTGCRLNGLELRAPLGRGAMGVVFRAHDPGLGRPAAVKMLAPELAALAAARSRFAREARTAAAVRHENVVAVHAVGEADGVPYLVMEYVDGVALDAHVDAHGPLPLPAVVRVGRQIAAGLGAAHAKGITHRDVKPANILLESESGAVKVADFGLARGVKDVGLSRSGALIGTPHFMSPEQAEGRPATAASDLYSLGAVLYALATGELPFPGTALMAVLLAVCADPPVPPRRHRPTLPAWFEEVVLRLLEKRPADRFRSAGEVAAALAGGAVG